VNGARRFYREVSCQAEGRGEYRVLLDGKPVRTPAGALLGLPSAALAEAIAAEWLGQGEKLRPETMALTKLANTAIDQVRPNRQQTIAQILAFARSDLVCYRAEAPDLLVQRQIAEWNPLLEWARTRYGANFISGNGIAFIEQPAQALAALERAISERDDFTVAGLHAAVTLLGSAVIALALLEGRLTPDQAFAAAQLDEIFQAERWGQDLEAQNLSRRKAAELSDIAGFLSALRD